MKKIARAMAVVAVAIGLPIGTAWAGAPTVKIDSDGCEIASGYNQLNRCNSSARTDKKTFLLSHVDTAFQGHGAGASAFAQMVCSFGYTLYKGAVQDGDKQVCHNGDADYASKSICGQASICSTKVFP